MEVGDRVTASPLKSMKPTQGTIIFIDNNSRSQTILVEHDEYGSFLHDGNGKGKPRRCWYYYENEVTLLVPKTVYLDNFWEEA